MIRKIWKDQRGQDTVEYALIVAFIASAAAAISPAVAAVAVHFAHAMGILNVALAATAG